MIIIACPGQGSQTPGFLKEWIKDPNSKAFLETLSDASGVDLEKHGTESDAETIRDTAIAQPLIVAASLLSWQVVKETLSTHTPVGFAGHSVGEFAAAALSGILSPEEAMRLVGVRGRAMAEAAATTPTGMAAVVGGKEEEVLEAIKESGLTPANRNGSGQIVAAGRIESIERLKELAPRGARVVPLQVAGAFHTDFMAPAVQVLADEAKTVSVADPLSKIWTNHDGTVIESGAKYLELLINQIAQPVRWDLCMESFSEHEISALVELTPAGTLTGIAKRALRGTPSVAIKTPEDIHEAVALITNHTS